MLIVFPILGALVSLFGDIILIKKLFEKKYIEQSFTTFFLWGLLDFISFLILKKNNDNYYYLLPLSYSVGSFLTAFFLFYKRRKNIYWGWREIIIIILSCLCLYVWVFIGDQEGIISSIFALIVSSIPQIMDTYKNPKSTPSKVYFIFLIGATISFLGTDDYIFEIENLYSFVCIIIEILIIIFSQKRNIAKFIWNL